MVQAQDLLQQRHFGKAYRLIGRVEEIAPKVPDTYFLKGRLLTELRQLKKAQVAYQKVVERAPSYPGVYFNMGNNLLRQGQWEEALTWYRKAYHHRFSPDVLIHMGRAYAKLNKPDSARRAYHRVLASDSTNATAHFRLAELSKDQGNLSGALAHIREALDMNPNNMAYRYQLGLLLLKQGRAEEAAGHLKAVINDRPWHHSAHYNLGQALLQNGKDQQARQHLVWADSLEQQRSQLEKLQQLAEMHPDQPRRWIALGDALRQARRPENALQMYQIALALMPQDLTLRNTIANLQALDGQFQEAVESYRAVLRQDSTLVEVWFNLGLTHAREGDLKRARKAWHRALTVDPGHRKSQQYLARTTPK